VGAYCWEWKSWLLWDGTRWRRDAGDGPMRLAKATARSIYHDVTGLTSPDERAELAKWAIRSESEPRLQAMLTLAQSEPEIPVRPEDLDGDRLVLNVANGTIDLRTGELRAHRRLDLITKLVPVVYDADAGARSGRRRSRAPWMDGRS
jgi:putative DNA primase/helicase